MSRPSVSAIAALLADLAAYRKHGIGDYAELMNRKADLLGAIAAERPGDTEAAETVVAVTSPWVQIPHPPPR